MSIEKVDRFQRRHPVLGFPIAVVYKFFDDQGNFLAATVSYYAFVSIFPLLLLASSIFGFVLQGRPELGTDDRELRQRRGERGVLQLGAPEGLTGSVTAVVVGALAATYGALGLGQAAQNVMNAAWSVPRNSRPNPVLMRLRSLLLLVVAGVAVLGISVFSAVGAATEMFGPAVNATIRLLIQLATVVIVTAVLTSLFRLAAARSHSWARALPGALFTALGWQALQLSGAFYATRDFSGDVPAFNVGEIVDATGAGDAFLAATLVHLSDGPLDEEERVREAALRGCAAGALACTDFGAMRALPTKEELDKLMSNG